MKGDDNMSLLRKRKTDSGSKHIMNVPMLDLRRYVPDALKNIETLNAAIVVLPKEENRELMVAYGSIPRKNVASEIYVENDSEIKFCNGFSEIDCAVCDENTVYFINGFAVIKNAAERTISVGFNGSIICENGAKINLIFCNGEAKYVNFKIKSVKHFSKNLTVDKDFIENIEDGTVVSCGNILTLPLDVTPDLLKSKKIYFFAGNTIKCAKRALGTVQTMSFAKDYKTLI